MSRMPPSLSGGLACASAAVADIASAQAKTPVKIRFIKASQSICRIVFAALEFLLPRSCRMACTAARRGEFVAGMRFSAKRNDLSVRTYVDGDVGKNRICDRVLRDSRILQHRIHKLWRT